MMALPLRSRHDLIRFQTLKEAIKGEARYEYNWFQFFGLKKDPTDSVPVTADFDANLVDRQAEIKMIAMILASAAKGSSAIVTLVGPEGSGRTSLANFLMHLNTLATPQNIEILAVPMRELVMYKPDRISDFFTERVPKDTNLLMLDDCEDLGSTLADIVRESVVRQSLKFIVTSPAHLLALRERDESVAQWKVITVKPLTERDAVSFLRGVIMRSLEEDSRYASLVESEAVLKTIYASGMGVPGLMLKLLRQSFLLAYNKDMRLLDKASVVEAAAKGGYEDAVRHLTKSKLSEKLFETLLALHLTTNFLLGPQGYDGATANQLEEDLEVDRSTVVHYLSQLHEKGLVTKRKHGRLVYYKVPQPAQVAVELDCIKRTA